MEQSTSFGYWLRRRRKALDLTQEELARRVCCALGTIKKLETDERRPSRELAARLADSLGVTADERAAFLQAARAQLPIDQLTIQTQPLSPPSTPIAAQPTGLGVIETLTFLFTDIKGSVSLWDMQPQAMKTALARHDALVRAAIVMSAGVVFKNLGDGFLATFKVATDAVAAARTIQRTIQAEEWGSIGVLQVCIALHTGEIEARDNDYFGPTLNRVMLLARLAHGGQVLLSQATAILIQDQLSPEMQLREIGVYPLKGLTRPEHIFQLEAPDIRSEFPPLQIQ